ncbi:MAG: hypothetical protein ABL918_11475 [Chakrabartia sp.]
MIELEGLNMFLGKNCRYVERYLCLIFSIIVFSTLPASAVAQTPLQPITIPETRQALDEHQVNILNANYRLVDPGVSIGGAEGGLSFERYWVSDVWRHNMLIAVFESSSNATVSIGNQSVKFRKPGGVYTAAAGDGSTLVRTGAINTNYT